MSETEVRGIRNTVSALLVPVFSARTVLFGPRRVTVTSPCSPRGTAEEQSIWSGVSSTGSGGITVRLVSGIGATESLSVCVCVCVCVCLFV